VRRNFEDEFVVQLQAAGVDALASYRYIPENQGIDEDKLKEAAQRARADAVLFPRLVQTEQKTKLGPTFPYLSVSSAQTSALLRKFGWGGAYAASAIGESSTSCPSSWSLRTW
jgi:hypothetical protein